jgi:hypothetical protein
MELPAGWPESNEDWLPPTETGKPNASCVTHPSKVSQYRNSSPPVTRRRDSRGVNLSCRVYARNSSDSLVRHSDFDLKSLDLIPAVFLSQAFREIPNDSPPGLNSPSEPNERPGPKRPTITRERWQPAGLLSLGLIPLQRIESKRPLHTALPQPLRSAHAVSHDLDGLLHFDPFRGLPRKPLMGFLPFRGPPAPAGPAHH